MSRTQTQHFMINLSNANLLSIDCYDVSFSSCIFVRLLLHRSDCTRRVRTYMNSIMCTKLWQLIYSYCYCPSPCPIACGVRVCAAAIVSNVCRLSLAICRFNTFIDSMTKTNAIHCRALSLSFSRSNSNFSERVKSINIRFVYTCAECMCVSEAHIAGVDTSLDDSWRQTRSTQHFVTPKRSIFFNKVVPWNFLFDSFRIQIADDTLYGLSRGTHSSENIFEIDINEIEMWRIIKRTHFERVQFHSNRWPLA